LFQGERFEASRLANFEVKEWGEEKKEKREGNKINV
jgi:hypothetical protein